MSEKSIWEKPISHGEILKKIWKHLDLGVLEREHPFHTPVFASIGADGAPHARTIVLRRFWRKAPRLAFHTHSEAPKISEIRLNPQVAFSLYHPQEKFQLRVKALAQIHTDDDLADAQWLETGFFSRRAYTCAAPSQVSRKPTSGLPDGLTQQNYTETDPEAGRANFAVISASVCSIDCMELDVRGHRRSLFIWNADGEMEAKWLTP